MDIKVYKTAHSFPIFVLETYLKLMLVESIEFEARVQKEFRELTFRQK